MVLCRNYPLVLDYLVWHCTKLQCFFLPKEAKLATKNSSQASLILICIKLTTVMGLTWTLGLLANWNQTAFLEYPSTVLNSMQGDV